MKHKKMWVFILLILGMSLGLSGCKSIRQVIGSRVDSTSDTAGMGYNIYYINEDETKLYAVAYQLTSTTEDGIIEECLTALQTESENEGYLAVLYDFTSLERYRYNRDTRTLYLYLGSSYTGLSKTTKMLVQAAIVKTMTQFSGIVDYVSINIGGVWLKDSDGNALLMKSSDYETDVTSNPRNLAEAEIVLYFASEDGTGLVRCEVTQKYYTTSSMASVVMEALIRGPVDGNGKAVLSTNTQVRNIYIEDGLCQIDFNHGFLEELDGQSFMLNVYAVVNTLTELSDVSKVQITVDGQSVENAPDGVKMSGTLRMNKSLIVKEVEETQE